jgi:hypothetical protein
LNQNYEVIQVENCELKQWKIDYKEGGVYYDVFLTLRTVQAPGFIYGLLKTVNDELEATGRTKDWDIYGLKIGFRKYSSNASEYNSFHVSIPIFLENNNGKRVDFEKVSIEVWYNGNFRIKNPNYPGFFVSEFINPKNAVTYSYRFFVKANDITEQMTVKCGMPSTINLHDMNREIYSKRFSWDF